MSTSPIALNMPTTETTASRGRNVHHSNASSHVEELDARELWWQGKYDFLLSKGYALRARYRPGWIASWTLPENEGLDANICEDALVLPPAYSDSRIDATRLTDGRLVYLKRIVTGTNEAAIISKLSAKPLSTHSDNHTIPLLSIFEDVEAPQWTYLVMPFLREVTDPPLEKVADVIDLVDQLLEGLVFMHANDIAHRKGLTERSRDCTYDNIVMDADALFPEQGHPIVRNWDARLERRLPVLPRRSATVKYYFIDFGLSTDINTAPEPSNPENRPQIRRADGQLTAAHWVLGRNGKDRDVPELSNKTYYHAFLVDIFTVGNFFRQWCYQKYSNVEFLRELIGRMTAKDAGSRPSAEDALSLWRRSRDGVPAGSSSRRLKKRAETLQQSLFLDAQQLLDIVVQIGREWLHWVTELQG